MLLLAVCVGSWANPVTGTITFGTNNVKINASVVDATDDLSNSWTITTIGTTSYTANNSYYQVGSSSKPATSICFQMNLSNAINITSVEAKFGGFNSTAGDVSIKIGESVSDNTEVGSGNLNAANDVTVTSTSGGTGKYLEVYITNIAKGVKCYYISYTYDDGQGSNLTNSDLALTGAPIALNFDLYNNSAAQTVSYTTSSTGAVTVSGGEGYVTTSVSGNTITVTPVAVTPSAQTITVSQAADDDYKAGSVSFTVSVTDSTPFAGGDVTFVCGTDKTSENSLTKNGVTMSFESSSDGTWDRTDNYRLYSGKSMTISTATGKITQIVFTISQNNFSGNGYNSETKTWTGSASSVTLAAAGGQVRFTPVVVTVDMTNKQPCGLEYATTEYTVNLGESFTTPTLTNPNGLAVTYSSSKESVATVANDGTVTILAAGTTDITATFAGNDTYEAGSASYKLKVVDPNANDGSAAKPYTVAEVIDGTATGSDVYVKGYIVGEYASNSVPKTSGFSGDTNFAMADEFTTTPTAGGCIPVQLPSSSGLQGTWGLSSNAGRVTYEVVVKGDILTYFTVAGIKNTSEVTATGVYVKIADSGKSSYCASDAIQMVEGVRAYIVTNVTSTSATMTEITDAVPANTGIMLVGTGGTGYTLPVASSGATTADVTSNMLFGTANGTTVEDVSGTTYLALSGGEFVKMNPGTIKAHKAYLSVNSSILGDDSKLAISFDDGDATAIDEVKSTKQDGVFYNLNGMRVNAPQKGIYILNGKKIVVK